MASIIRIEGKNGAAYKITVACGRDLSGKQIRHYKTWTPEPKMTERQIEREVQRAAYEFERQLKLGYAADDRQTFAAYSRYVLDLKTRAGCKRRTVERYQELLTRIIPAIGHFKLSDIRPQHLNDFYKNLGEAGVSRRSDKAIARADLHALMISKGITKAALSSAAGISVTTVSAACRGERLVLASAEAIAKTLGSDTNRLFILERDNSVLSPKTILEHHRLVSAILSHAEKEMLVAYNAAAKATPPVVTHKAPNYFQIGDVERIRNALEQEPIKWRTMAHLLLLTGCRRGEVAGLKWSRIGFEHNKITIDCALLYSAKSGIYEDTPKNRKTRFIKLPAETMLLLREYRRWYLELKLKNGERWHDTDYLFVRDDGTPMIPDGITAWLSDFSKRHGLPHINPHAFRHTMASILIKNGQDIVSVSKRLGHAKVSTTTDFYAQIMEEADEEAGESLADVILRTKPNG